MNSLDMAPSTTLSTHTDTKAANASEMGLSTSLPTQADTTMIQVTTAAPTSTDAVVAVVIVLILLTVAALGFLLYRYLCHNKGDYRTTGEPAPGEDPDDEQNNQDVSEKKEYFI
ncbi:small cell adhesion glycoprotein-like [Clinocottus analis]|uniref:small cell adhesion glycoprotein-like n=1 Tax=Clinocottus analis TaxID=304258 RepID=UPI0035C048F8